MVTQYARKITEGKEVYYMPIVTAELSTYLLDLYQYETTQEAKKVKVDLVAVINGKAYTPEEAKKLLDK